MWKLGKENTPAMFALQSLSSTYPLGKTLWKVKN